MAPLLASQPRRDRAFERLYRRHVGDVYRYAYAVLQNRADAEDVTQTTFLNAYRAFERGERPAKPHNWLIAIAHNVCRQRFRQSQRRPSEVALYEETVETLVEDDETPTGEDIRRALSYLAFNQRAALVMRELEGRSYAEIAEVLELSVSAVETLIFRARRALREQLEGALTCREAELAISKQLDGRLSRGEKGALRAHLRECAACSTLARRQRAQRSALKAFGSVPLPMSLASFFGGGGGGGSVAASAVAAKAAAVVVAAAVAGGASYEAVDHVTKSTGPRKTHVAAAAASASSAHARPTASRVSRLAAPGSERAKGGRATLVHPGRGSRGGPARPVAVPRGKSQTADGSKSGQRPPANVRGYGTTKPRANGAGSTRLAQRPSVRHPKRSRLAVKPRPAARKKAKAKAKPKAAKPAKLPQKPAAAPTDSSTPVIPPVDQPTDPTQPPHGQDPDAPSSGKGRSQRASFHS